MPSILLCIIKIISRAGANQKMKEKMMKMFALKVDLLPATIPE